MSILIVESKCVESSENLAPSGKLTASREGCLKYNEVLSKCEECASLFSLRRTDDTEDQCRFDATYFVPLCIVAFLLCCLFVCICSTQKCIDKLHGICIKNNILKKISCLRRCCTYISKKCFCSKDNNLQNQSILANPTDRNNPENGEDPVLGVPVGASDDQNSSRNAEQLSELERRNISLRNSIDYNLDNISNGRIFGVAFPYIDTEHNLSTLNDNIERGQYNFNGKSERNWDTEVIESEPNLIRQDFTNRDYPQLSRRFRRQQEEFEDAIHSSYARNQIMSMHFNPGNMSSLVRQRESEQARRQRNRNRRVNQMSMQRANTRESTNSIHSILQAMRRSMDVVRVSDSPDPVLPEMLDEENQYKAHNDIISNRYEKAIVNSKSVDRKSNTGSHVMFYEPQVIIHKQTKSLRKKHKKNISPITKKIPGPDKNTTK